MTAKLLQLSKEQKTEMGKYVERWKGIGLCTAPADTKAAEEGIRLIYKDAELALPEIVWMDNPFELLEARKSPLAKTIPNPQGLQNSILHTIREKSEHLAWASVCRKTHPLLRNLVYETIWQSLQQAIDPITTAIHRLYNSMSELARGQFDAPWLAMYEYYQDVLQIKGVAKLQGYMMVAKATGYYLPTQDICWMCKRPTTIHMNTRGQLHCQDREALGFPGGWKHYSLNGVEMKREHILTPADKLSLSTVLGEQNVDVKAQLIRKVGVMRFVDKGKVVEESGYYKLIDMSPLLDPNPPSWRSDRSYFPYLMMLNPSVPGLYHLEGVGADCRTIKQAHAFRYKRVCDHKVFSPDGEDWYQHGDVLIYPEDAIALKPFPVVMT
jgi:hypothetical protein